MGNNKRVADNLLKIAARRSTETPFGWAHPDCIVLQEAARLLKGKPEKAVDDKPPGVLSS
jgi:hypothetical protein